MGRDCDRGGGVVIQLTFAYGALPWIAFGLAASFGSYGLAKKKAPLDPLEGLTLETAILASRGAPVSRSCCIRSGEGAFLRTGATSDALMIGGGLVTTVPLLLFAAAVRTVPLSVIGILQYIGPTHAVHPRRVRVSTSRFRARSWSASRSSGLALAIYAGDSLRARRGPGDAGARRRHGLTRTCGHVWRSAGAVAEAIVVEAMLVEAAQWVDALGEVMWDTGELSPERIAAETAAGQFVLAIADGEPAGAIRFQLEDTLFWPDLPPASRPSSIGSWSGAATRDRVSRLRCCSGPSITRVALGRTHLRLDCDKSRPKLMALYEGFGFQFHSFRQVGPYYVARYEYPLRDSITIS